MKISIFSRKNVPSRLQNSDSAFAFVWCGICTKNLKYFGVISLILVIMIYEIKGDLGECDSKLGSRSSSIHGRQ